MAGIVAAVDGWSMVVLATLTIICSLTSVMGLAMGLAMAAVGVIEIRGSQDLKRLLPRAPRRLALNQIGLGLLLVIYGGVNCWRSLHQAHPLASLVGGDPELTGMLSEYEGLARNLSVLVYAGVIGLGIVGPGLMAWYYHSRGPILQRYLRQTPQWLLELQHAGMSV